MNPFIYSPCDIVIITLHGLNYRGRITECVLLEGSVTRYRVEYVNDAGDFKEGTFRGDEIGAPI